MDSLQYPEDHRRGCIGLIDRAVPARDGPGRPTTGNIVIGAISRSARRGVHEDYNQRRRHCRADALTFLEKLNTIWHKRACLSEAKNRSTAATAWRNGTLWVVVPPSADVGAKV
jgi:hypothetical protein